MPTKSDEDHISDYRSYLKKERGVDIPDEAFYVIRKFRAGSKAGHVNVHIKKDYVNSSAAEDLCADRRENMLKSYDNAVRQNPADASDAPRAPVPVCAPAPAARKQQKSSSSAPSTSAAVPLPRDTMRRRADSDEEKEKEEEEEEETRMDKRVGRLEKWVSGATTQMTRMSERLDALQGVVGGGAQRAPAAAPTTAAAEQQQAAGNHLELGAPTDQNVSTRSNKLSVGRVLGVCLALLVVAFFTI